MWLLDANMPIRLVDVLQEFGGLNPRRFFSEAAARSLRQIPAFSVVLVRLPQLRGSEFLDAFRRAWQEEPIRPVAGTVLAWPERAQTELT